MIALKKPSLGWMVRYVGLPVLVLGVWDFLIVVAYEIPHWTWVGSAAVPLALYGTAISIIVGFRNNYAYGRWWEARTLWGAIVNRSRTVARQVLTTMSAPTGATEEENAEVAAMQRKLVYYQIAYVHALRQQLRGLDPIAEIRNLVSAEQCEELIGDRNVSLALQRKMGAMMREARRRGWVNEWEWQAIDGSLSALMDSQGGAERIKNTPMPKQYDFFPTLFVEIYCLMLPIGMVEKLEWFTPLGSTLVGFMFLALDKIGRDLEDPFANGIYDVPLTAITTTIETNLRQMLGDRDLPPPLLAPKDGVLW
jgi:ion channel-forming bestrophin family protein